MMSAYERHILPIYVILKQGSEEQFRPMRFAGTGFIAAPHVFVTCWHCVSDELPEEQTYAVLRYPDGTVHQLSLIVQDPSGSDLASAHVDIPTWPPFDLVVAPPDVTGLNVGTIGYPGTHPEEQPDGTLASTSRDATSKAMSVGLLPTTPQANGRSARTRSTCRVPEGFRVPHSSLRPRSTEAM